MGSVYELTIQFVVLYDKLDVLQWNFILMRVDMAKKADVRCGSASSFEHKTVRSHLPV